MTPGTDEAALWRAIEADPRDDAPWLVYADWLDDHGRDREAANVRRFLPDAQAAVVAGRPVPAMMGALGRIDAVGGWGLVVPEPQPAALPQAPPLGKFERPPTDSVGRQLFMWAAFGALVLLGRLIAESAFRPPDPPPPLAADLFRPHWRADELIDHTFELQSKTEVLVFALDKGGKARIAAGKPGEPPAEFDGRWSIVPNGPLRITRSDGTLVCELEKEERKLDSYLVTRNGRREVFQMDWTPRLDHNRRSK